MWEACLGVPTLKSWALTCSTKLFDCFESGSVVTTETIMALCVTNDKWYVRMHHNWECLASILQLPIKPLLLQPFEPGLFKNKLYLNVHLVEKVCGPTHVGKGLERSRSYHCALWKILRSPFL
jgi:hypothetical protein